MNGTYRPDRHAAPAPEHPIDPDPPAGLDSAQRAAWSELVTVGGDLLAQSDRIAVELCARLVAKMRGADALTAAEVAQLSAMLHRLGLTAAGRRAIDRVRGRPDENPFDQF